MHIMYKDFREHVNKKTKPKPEHFRQFRNQSQIYVLCIYIYIYIYICPGKRGQLVTLFHQVKLCNRLAHLEFFILISQSRHSKACYFPITTVIISNAE